MGEIEEEAVKISINTPPNPHIPPYKIIQERTVILNIFLFIW